MLATKAQLNAAVAHQATAGRTLSLPQPFAALLIYERIRVKNHQFAIHLKRGGQRFMIHTGQQPEADALEKALAKFPELAGKFALTGQVIGSIQVSHIEPRDQGRHRWHFTQPQPCRPFPWRGAHGVFTTRMPIGQGARLDELEALIEHYGLDPERVLTWLAKATAKAPNGPVDTLQNLTPEQWAKMKNIYLPKLHTAHLHELIQNTEYLTGEERTKAICAYNQKHGIQAHQLLEIQWGGIPRHIMEQAGCYQ